MANIIFTIALIAGIACVLGIIYCIYLLYRNRKVYKFRMIIIDMDSINNTNLWDKYEYSEMLYSFKPLQLDAWFTKKELKNETK